LCSWRSCSKNGVEYNATHFNAQENAILYGGAPAGYCYAKHEEKKAKDSRTAGEIISEEKKGLINREFPDEWRDKTYGEIDKAAKSGDQTAHKAKKLLNDHRFDKR
jgi:hypothetical protein